MNRAERRKQEQSGISKAHIMEQYRKEAYDRGWYDGMTNVIEITFYMTAYTLQYKLGFGRKRLQWIMQAIYNNIDAYRTQHLSTEDYKTIVEQMRDDYGIKLN